MKNVVVLHRNYPLPGGSAVLLRRIIEGLSDGFGFKVLSFQEGPNVVRVKTRLKDPYFALLSFHVKAFAALYRLRRKGGIDVILNTGTSSLGGAVFGKLYGIPTITRISGTRMDLYRKRKERGLGRIKKFLYWRILLLEMLSYWLSETIIVPTEYSRKTVVEAYPFLKGRIRVIHEGAMVPARMRDGAHLRGEHGIGPQERVVAFNTYTTKPELFRETLSLMNKEMPGVVVLEIEAHTVKIRRGDEASMTLLAGKEALELADVLVCAPLFEESHSTLALEAFFLDVPLIAPDNGWFREEFEPLFLLPETSAKEIVKKLSEFYGDRGAFMKKTAEQKEALLKKYDIKKTLAEYASLLNGS